MQIVFINYGPYCVASGVHIHFIANELTELGHECTVVLPSLEGRADNFGQPNYEIIDSLGFAERIAQGKYDNKTIFHSWTPREWPRQITLMASQTIGARYFVHLEDNERRILESHFKKPYPILLKETARGQLKIGESGLSHPILHQAFLAEANGVTVLMDKLAEFVPPGVPSQLIWPACEPAFLQISPTHNSQAREKMGIAENCTVILYPGNVHHAVVKTVSALYQALPLIDAAGFPVCLIRCAGSDSFPPCPDAHEIMRKHGKYFPNIRSCELPAFMELADILVQPGAPDDFDEYRFPSKLPLFLASGRPVILARANLGRFLTDGVNCLILEQNTPEAIAARVIELLRDPDLARAIGQGGRMFASQNFSWRKTALTLLEFYKRTEKTGQK